VEIVRVKRKVLWTLDEETGEAAVEQEQINKEEEGAILDSDTDSKKYMAVDTRLEGGYRKHMEVTESVDQFFIDHQARAVHPGLKKEALAILST